MKTKLDRNLDKIEFYDLMHSYRMAALAEQAEVATRFEAVKEWVRQNYATDSSNK